MPAISTKKLIIIAGPTAVGKTALAVNLAKHLQTEIISADSRQFYKEMCIGTARPTEAEMQGIAHHFSGHLSVYNDYNAGRFEEEAIKKLNELFKERNVVMMCGGSGLFIDAVCNGFDTFEKIDEALRKQLNEDYHNFGLGWLQQQVKEKDPAYFMTADINNPRRLLRALEVCLSTGRAYSSFKSGTKKQRPFEVIKILLNLEREELYKRINQRAEQMLQNGWLKEAESLLPLKELNALNTVGYKELFEFMEGKINYERAIELIKQNTRHYAKRQLTWFRKDRDYVEFRPEEEEKIKAFLEVIIKT